MDFGDPVGDVWEGCVRHRRHRVLQTEVWVWIWKEGSQSTRSSHPQEVCADFVLWLLCGSNFRHMLDWFECVFHVDSFTVEHTIGKETYTYVFQLCGDAGGVKDAGVIQIDKKSPKTPTVIGKYTATQAIGGSKNTIYEYVCFCKEMCTFFLSDACIWSGVFNFRVALC